jgi:hypothetical protein
MDRLYSTPTWQLAIALFIILLGGMFTGFLLGKNAARHGEQETGAADSAVKGAVAGLSATGFSPIWDFGPIPIPVGKV